MCSAREPVKIQIQFSHFQASFLVKSHRNNQKNLVKGVIQTYLAYVKFQLPGRCRTDNLQNTYIGCFCKDNNLTFYSLNKISSIKNRLIPCDLEKVVFLFNNFVDPFFKAFFTRKYFLRQIPQIIFFGSKHMTDVLISIQQCTQKK